MSEIPLSNIQSLQELESPELPQRRTALSNNQLGLYQSQVEQSGRKDSRRDQKLK